MSTPGVRLTVLAAMMLPMATPAGAAPCACGGGSVFTWLPRQGLLRFYEGYEPRYPYAWWGGEWRHHGPGEGSYCNDRGVRSLHGLGDGCYGQPVHVRPFYFVNVDEPYTTDAPQLLVPPEDPGGSAPPVEAPEEAAPGGAVPQHPELAWSFVDRRAAQRGLREFALEALRHPEDAEAKAGFGIAAAILGQDEKACWGLRRAAATDVDSLHALVAPGGGAERQIRQLITRYGARRGADARFVTAMLHWLLGEDTMALQNAAIAIAAGDADPALAAISRSTRKTEADPPVAKDGNPVHRVAEPADRGVATPLTALGNAINYRSVENASQ